MWSEFFRERIGRESLPDGVDMAMVELLAGESKNTEYKQEVPSNSTGYMKTVVAFSNGLGGKIVFGIEDKTLKVVGVNRDNLFKKMDAITNAISHCCEPKIIPDITLHSIEDKTVIVVEIIAGKQRPYFLKSQGIVKGTYIRVSGTTRLIEDFMLKELILDGQNRYYDSEPCDDLTVTKEDIADLCMHLRENALKNAMTDAEKSNVKVVTENVLLSWGIFIEKEGELFPTNAYALLSGRSSMAPAIQCAIFKGTDRSFFVDRREFKGAIQDQMEAVYQYVLEKINLGARIQGIYRQDIYELPIDAVRELIANAVAHRNYLDPGSIQVALYDDRLEITSPGMLLSGVSIQKMKEGYSRIRNRAIASAFSYMKIIEKWGSGIPRVIRACKEYGLPEPDLIDFDGDFRVNVYRSHSNRGTNGTNHGTNGTNGTNHGIIYNTNATNSEQHLMDILRENPKVTQKKIQGKTGLSLRTVKRVMSELQKNDRIMRRGTSRSGEWVVTK